ncbi:hypothetical protein SISSUDRAFT_445849 [Sistotremastrum suecicum HHB10207 ss-3]|uniref:Alpha-galactosidase n=1 Tax=Sistotremastrum suecicum HHB10207 ss-3 TaxID=1314776 RepID=A0A165YAI7_9AGAM|nr:hypothetical protein SISSUDRAFT_445849 [Sistotremastrum suecicum HHB10207 ss-3]
MPYIGPGDVHPGSIFLPSHAMTPSPSPSRSSHHGSHHGSHISHHHHHHRHEHTADSHHPDPDSDADLESSKEIFDIFPSLNPQTDIRRINLENCLLTFPLDHGTPGQISTIELGKLGEGVRSMVRLTREKLFWLSPRVGRREEGLSANLDTQVLILQLDSSSGSSKVNGHGGKVAVILPLTEPEYMGTLRGSPSIGGGIVARFERDVLHEGPGEDSEPLYAKLIISFSPSPHSAIQNAIDSARLAAGTETNSSVLDSERSIFSDGLTYCTWNSLQPPVGCTTTQLFKTLNHFNSLSIYPSTLLIDDGWQDVHDLTLRSFDSRPEFLDGMKDLGEVVKRAKEGGVLNVGVWHTIGGYWQGVDPLKFKDEYQLIKVATDGYPGPAEPEGFSYYLPHPSDVGRFFSDYYARLAAHGITFTKCDNVASFDSLRTAHTVSFSSSPSSSSNLVETLGEELSIPSIRVAYKEAILSAATRHFGNADRGRVIWCMEMSPRVLMGREVGLKDGSSRYVCRNSDDYYPNEPDSHRYHIFTNAVNTLFTSHLNIIPDLDMFQSHPYIPPNQTTPSPTSDANQASYHAAFRAFGTGPITITDVAGHTNSSIVNKLIGKALGSERSVALQAGSSSWINGDIFDGGLLEGGSGKALRIFSRASSPGLYGGLVGYWNIRSGNGIVSIFFSSRSRC